MCQEISFTGSRSHHHLDHLADLLKLVLIILRKSNHFIHSPSNRTQSNQTLTSSLTSGVSSPPLVYVLDTSSPIAGGTLVKINYPSLSVLAEHSQRLTETILQVLISLTLP
jgi:ribonuclease BN (tRNA processing enzyme)